MATPLIQIVDENDRPIGEATKQEAWDKGLIHRVARLMVFNQQGKLLLQHRSPTKDIFPNCWDVAAAGHVDPGEDYETAVRREAEEEMDATGLDLTEVGYYKSSEVWQGRKLNRFNRCYSSIYSSTPTKLEADKIDGWRWLDLAMVKKMVKDHPEQVSDGLRQVIERFY